MVCGPLALILVPQIGGRVIGMQWNGHELAFVDPKLEGRVEDVTLVDDVAARKRELGLLFWGGEKTWLAPQELWTDGTSFLDLDSGAYTLELEQSHASAATVRMTSPVCRETGIQITRSITMDAAWGGWQIVHRLQNCSDVDARWAPWSVSMVRRPARVYLPIRKDSLHERGVKTFTEEGESEVLRDDVVALFQDMAIIDCTGARKFKFGVDADLGFILAIIDVEGLGRVGYARAIPTYHPQPYGHGCVAEVFNACEFPYLETELHGPVVNLEPGQSFDLIEHAALFDVTAIPADASELRKLYARMTTRDRPTVNGARKVFEQARTR